MYWVNSFQNIYWLRNHVVAPLSEEFTFRACMMPLLLQTFKPLRSILITPLFFGIAHLHHIIERYKNGMQLKVILLVSGMFSRLIEHKKNLSDFLFLGFQFLYTSVFGIYSAFLFARTGHFIAPFIVHAFCNHMGFPDVQEVLNQPEPKKHILLGLYVIGFISWIVLLPILTEPNWYLNDLYWQNNTVSV